ncbi:MAG: OmpA family protein [Pseudomonadota bacterium]
MKLKSSLMIAASAFVLVACAEQEVTEDTAEEAVETVVEETAPVAAAEPEIPLACRDLDDIVYFATDEVALDAFDLNTIRTMSGKFFECDASSADIMGTASRLGETGYNQTLSENRANEVAAVFRGEGIADSSMTVYGVGEDPEFQQISQPDGSDNPLNRRVVITLE